MRLPGSSAGRVSGACSPCTGRGLTSRSCRQDRWWALTPPFHPYLSRLRRSAIRRSVFCVTFRRLSPPLSRERPALRCPDFPRALRARGHPACGTDCTGPSSLAIRPCRRIPHSGQRTCGPSWRTNSPQTGHSSDAPRSTARSSCSSDRWRGATELTAAGTPPRPCRGSARSRRRSARARCSRAGAECDRSRGRSA